MSNNNQKNELEVDQQWWLLEADHFQGLIISFTIHIVKRHISCTCIHNQLLKLVLINKLTDAVSYFTNSKPAKEIGVKIGIKCWIGRYCSFCSNCTTFRQCIQISHRHQVIYIWQGAKLNPFQHTSNIHQTCSRWHWQCWGKSKGKAKV